MLSSESGRVSGESASARRRRWVRLFTSFDEAGLCVGGHLDAAKLSGVDLEESATGAGGLERPVRFTLAEVLTSR